MSRDAYLAATKGGTDRAAARSFSDKAQRSYSSQQNNRTGQTNQGTRQSSFDLKSGTSGKDNEIRNADGLTQAEVKQMKALADKRNEAAYQESLKRQADMRRAIDMAYGTKRLSPEEQKAYDEETLKLLEAGVPDVGIGKRSIIDESPSTFHTLTDKQKQFLIDSGFAKAESSGVLGGTMGAELAENLRKKELGLDYDRSAVYSWSDVENDDYLKNAFYDMQSSNLTPRKYTSYMNNIGAFGHRPTNRFGGSGGSGGYGGYGGGGGGGDSYGGGGGGRGMPQGNPNEAWGAMSPLQQAMINTNAAPGFSQGYKRGGIVSLVC